MTDESQFTLRFPGVFDFYFQKFIDFSLSPEIQSAWLKAYKAIPVNQKAYPATSPELLDPETKVPWTKSKGFVRDIVWWSENRTKVNAAWSKWIAQ